MDDDRQTTEATDVTTRARRLLPFGVAATLWASEFAAIRIALEAYTPQHVVVFRYVLAALTLAGAAILGGARVPRRRDVPGLTLTGFFGFVLFTGALTVGERSVNAGTASLLVSSAPIFTVLLAAVLLGERLQVLGWIGVVISFAGMSLITVGTGRGLTLNVGALFIVGAAVAESVYFVLQKPFLSRYRPLEFATYVVLLGTPLLWVFIPGLVEQIRTAPSAATLAILYLGVCVSTLAPISWAYGLLHTSASASASFLYLIPVMAIVIAWALLGEVPSPESLFGGALVLAGVVMVHRR